MFSKATEYALRATIYITQKNQQEDPTWCLYNQKAKKLPVRSVLSEMGEDEGLEKSVLGLNECSEDKPRPMYSRY